MKIGLDNQVSIAMFKKLHFQEVMRSSSWRRASTVTGLRPERAVVMASVPGVGVSGVQGGDPRDDGG